MPACIPINMPMCAINGSWVKGVTNLCTSSIPAVMPMLSAARTRTRLPSFDARRIHRLPSNAAGIPKVSMPAVINSQALFVK